MKKRMCAEPATVDKLRDLLTDTDIEIVARPPCDVQIVCGQDRRESDLNTVYSGGWITCERARGLAMKLQLALAQTGELLNRLNVKIRHCSLGCFK